MPWVGETASPPAICGTDTLAIVMSSTTTKLASANAKDATNSRTPVSGCGSAGLADAAAAALAMSGSHVFKGIRHCEQSGPKAEIGRASCREGVGQYG